MSPRNSLSDLEAIAAMPGLEAIAEVLDPYRGHCGPLETIIFFAAQWPFQSRNQLTSTFWDTGAWDLAVKSAARVGRKLSPKPPSQHTLRHFRDRAPDGIGAAVAEVFATTTSPIVDAVGLLPDRPLVNPHRPDRESTIYGDGSTFTALSGVSVDPDTGEVIGSRSTGARGPCIAERYYGKTDGHESSGLPITMIGAHGGLPRQRVVLGVAMYFDRNETRSAMDLFHQVHEIYGPRVHALIYDRLMIGMHAAEIMRAGVVPIIDMRNAGFGTPYLVLPDSLRFLCGTGAQPRDHAVIGPLGPASHHVGIRACIHELWGLDGAVVSCAPREAPSVDSTIVEQTSTRWEPDTNNTYRYIGRYRIPCRHGSFTHELVLSGDRDNRSRKDNETSSPLADFVRPIDVTANLRELRGYRSDAESLYRTLKGQLALFGRASSLKPDHFLLDAVGGALWVNAVAWDVHGAQHTAAGQSNARAIENKRRRRVHVLAPQFRFAPPNPV